MSATAPGTVLLAMPPLYLALGIFLPLITTNCAVMGVTILVQREGYGLFESVAWGLAYGLGFTLALLLMWRFMSFCTSFCWTICHF